ncbi:Protein N-acetyltransferase, RimJ/RimL family [Friedmanniella luteola]|uniref:Protein N-acetyltransferase, RimJ/RimL family n=1 Tax=Friedmanniella luteola TaxID=546871 RepID=A0A1H1YQE2_9ACTN|nr:GNAT family N-acetyltransferase [Friedmanniella luteola]SDT23617.1 Protein N-acetyltransferase, RimJ/RimL family [Friedmanniella luteola]
MPAAPDAPALARLHPHGVPVLGDPSLGVTLRPLVAADLPRVVEQCRDPESIRWTTVPTPEGGYGLADARAFLDHVVVEGWRSGQNLCWAVEGADRPGVFCGSIDLRLHGDGLAEVGFGLHPDARGRHLMSGALRLVRDFAFDVARLRAVRWRAVVGNWGSRRVAAAAGWPCEGVVRASLVHRGELLDGWVGTLGVTDPRTPRPWSEPPLLAGPRLRLRPFTDDDADRVVEACRDPRTQHWLVSLSRTYTREHALDYVEGARESAATGAGLVWCVADAGDDRCLGAISLEGFGGYAKRAEIGYWAHPEARGRGVLTEATQRVTAWAEESGLVDSVLIRAAEGNTASRRVAVGAGYREVGVMPRCEPLGDGTTVDLVLYARP